MQQAVEFWESDSGKVPVKEFIEGLRNKKEVKKIIKKIEKVESIGINKMKQSGEIKPLPDIPLSELKIRFSNVKFRILFDIIDDKVFLFHIFKKNLEESQKKK